MNQDKFTTIIKNNIDKLINYEYFEKDWFSQKQNYSNHEIIKITKLFPFISHRWLTNENDILHFSNDYLCVYIHKLKDDYYHIYIHFTINNLALTIYYKIDQMSNLIKFIKTLFNNTTFI